MADILKLDNSKDRSKINILDFGCGSGFLVKQLQDLGYDAFGLDIFSEGIELSKNQGVKNLGITSGGHIDFPDKCFDYVLAVDVLEHIENETPIIKEIERVLAPGGKFIIIVPAWMFMWGKVDEVAHHFRRYRAPELIKTVEQAGNFKVVYKTYFNTFLFFPIAAVRLAAKWFNIFNYDSDFDINNRFLNSICLFIFNAERLFLPRLRFPFGVSIMTIMAKK